MPVAVRNSQCAMRNSQFAIRNSQKSVPRNEKRETKNEKSGVAYSTSPRYAVRISGLARRLWAVPDNTIWPVWRT